MGERMDEWKRVRSGQAKIVVGTRSAVFAPVQALGLIVMDEEQESTYKSESSPRYHAREIAKFRASYNKAYCLLCSATPSVESYFMAKSGRYRYHALLNRYGDALVPDVRLVDMNGEDRSSPLYPCNAHTAFHFAAFGRCLGTGLLCNLLRLCSSRLLAVCFFSCDKRLFSALHRLAGYFDAALYRTGFHRRSGCHLL